MSRYPVSKKMEADLENRFTYHAPKPGQPERYTALRDHAKELATHIVEETPPCREQSLALTHVEDAVFWANAAIARNDNPPVEMEEPAPDPEAQKS